jgi:succinate dehydrogenase / fumarate reductase, cytochrome b subunit
MELVNRVWRSSLGKKYLMALSGCALFLFVVGHLAGNLQIFIGPEAINRYGHFLQTTPEILWPARIGLLVLVTLHIITALRIWLENRAARPIAYATYEPVETTYAGRTVLVSGLIVAAFIVYHLLHFTAQTTALNFSGQDFTQFQDAQHRHDVFRMMVVGFNQPLAVAFYVVGMALLCFHLRHGLQAWPQSLGWRNDAWRGAIDRFALGAALAIFAGNCSIPLAILLGYGKEALK